MCCGGSCGGLCATSIRWGALIPPCKLVPLWYRKWVGNMRTWSGSVTDHETLKLEETRFKETLDRGLRIARRSFW